MPLQYFCGVVAYDAQNVGDWQKQSNNNPLLKKVNCFSVFHSPQGSVVATIRYLYCLASSLKIFHTLF